jgi:5-methylcytosine-specific restriction enzyme A
MPTYLFAWNPKLWDWTALPRLQTRLARRGHVDFEWSSGRTRELEPGSRAFLIRLGVPPKGIVGSGVTMTAPVTGPHWLDAKAAAGVTTNFLQLRMEALFEHPLITLDELADEPFAPYRWTIRQSGTYLPVGNAEALEKLWEERLAAAKRERTRSSMAAAKRQPRGVPGRTSPRRR